MLKPHNKTIKNVLAYLEEKDLSVYGPNMSEDGQEFPSQMDYTYAEIINRCKHIKDDTLYRID